MTNLAYPVGDTILAGLVLGAMVAGRGRLDRTWLCVPRACWLFAAVDGIYAYQVAVGTYVEGELLDILWPARAPSSSASPRGSRPCRSARTDYVPTIIVPVSIAAPRRSR